MRKPTIQPAAVVAVLALERSGAGHGSGLQILADHSDEEEGHDIGQDDGDDAAGRGAADVELQQGLGIDEEGDVGRLQPGPPPVVTRISAKTLSRKIVSIRMTTVIARLRWGRTM